MTKNRAIVSALLTIFICAGLPAQGTAQHQTEAQTIEQAQAAVRELSSLDEIVEYACSHNLSYRQDLWEVEKARDDIEGLLRLDRTSFTFSQDVSISEDSSTDEEMEYSTGITVPVIDQITLFSSINQDSDIVSGLNFSPLAHDDTNEQNIITYEKALIEAEQAALDVRKEALTTALTWMDYSRQLHTQEFMVTLKATVYEDEKVRYELGEASLDDVKEALLEWSEAQRDRTSLAQKERTARTNLYSTLQADTSKLTVSVLSMAALRQAIDELSADIDITQAETETTSEVLLAELDTRSLEEVRKNTWLFEPVLNAGLSVMQSADQDLQVGATVSVSFGLEDFNRAERDDLAIDIGLAREQHQQTLEQSKLEYEEQLLTLEASQASREIRNIELEQMELLKEEAEFLFGQGDMSELELEDARITCEQAENSLFSALVEEYTALLNLKSYISGNYE